MPRLRLDFDAILDAVFDAVFERDAVLERVPVDDAKVSAVPQFEVLISGSCLICRLMQSIRVMLIPPVLVDAMSFSWHIRRNC